jgi:hypothetical protein
MIRICICTFALVLTSAAIQSPATMERCDLAAFTTLNSSSVTIRAAERVDDARPARLRQGAGASTIASATVERPGLQSSPTSARCRVEASVSAAPGSLINFEVWIPAAGTASSS